MVNELQMHSIGQAVGLHPSSQHSLLSQLPTTTKQNIISWKMWFKSIPDLADALQLILPHASRLRGLHLGVDDTKITANCSSYLAHALHDIIITDTRNLELDFTDADGARPEFLRFILPCFPQVEHVVLSYGEDNDLACDQDSESLGSASVVPVQLVRLRTLALFIVDGETLEQEILLNTLHALRRLHITTNQPALIQWLHEHSQLNRVSNPQLYIAEGTTDRLAQAGSCLRSFSSLRYLTIYGPVESSQLVLLLGAIPAPVRGIRFSSQLGEPVRVITDAIAGHDPCLKRLRVLGLPDEVARSDVSPSTISLLLCRRIQAMTSIEWDEMIIRADKCIPYW